MGKVAKVFPVLALFWLTAAGAAHADAVVLVAEDGGFDSSTIQTVRTIASSELRARGVAVTDDPEYHATVPLTDDLLQALSQRGVERLFVLRLGRLGEKVMISMEELRAPDSTPLFASTLMASSIEEADTVIPRLVRSVLERIPPERVASWVVAAARSETAARTYREGARRLAAKLLDRPIGTPAAWLPAGVPERIEAALAGPLWDWLQGQVPDVVERLDVARRVEQKVLEFPTPKMEELIRKVTDRELKLIVRLGYVLGAMVGVVLVVVQHLMR